MLCNCVCAVDAKQLLLLDSDRFQLGGINWSCTVHPSTPGASKLRHLVAHSINNILCWTIYPSRYLKRVVVVTRSWSVNGWLSFSFVFSGAVHLVLDCTLDHSCCRRDLNFYILLRGFSWFSSILKWYLI